MNELTIPLPNPIDRNRMDELHSVAGRGPVLIVTHENPDPDALAAGKGLAALFEGTWGIPARMIYSGLVARAENKAMLKILTPEWEYSQELSRLEDYSAIALVDTQPAAGNNNLPDQLIPDIVIDHHHPLREGIKLVRYVDVRPEVGATVSMVYQYLEAAGITLDPVLATAIFYGIQTDTRGLSRGASAIDQAIYFKMLGMIEHSLLIEVEQAGLSRDYFRAFSQGLEAARIFGRTVLIYLGEMHRPDFVAEIADMLIRLQDARAVLCSGYHGSTLYLSLRTETGGEDAGIIVQRVIFPPGKAGGHGSMAGGQVPISDQPVDLLVLKIEGRFLDIMGETGQGEPLLPNNETAALGSQ